MFKIGCHLSSSKGYLAMGKEAAKIGANVFQFFTRNPRGGAAKPIDKDDVTAFLKFAKEHSFGPILAHAPYTMNAAAANPSILRFAHEIMEDDISRMDYTPGNYYNFHPGSHVQQGMEKGISLISEMLNDVLFPDMRTMVLLETMAGKGSEVGGKFEDLRAIMDNVKHVECLGVCLDTCHIWDGGYDIVNNLDGVLEEFDKIVGLSNLKAIHLNDSMNDYTAHKDRHAKIGEGKIGKDAIARIINHEALRDLPFYLETPNELDGYAAEIALLKKLRV